MRRQKRWSQRCISWEAAITRSRLRSRRARVAHELKMFELCGEHGRGGDPARFFWLLTRVKDQPDR